MNSKNIFKYGSNSLITTVLVVAIAVVANLFISLYDFKWDITPTKLNSIGNVSIKIAAKVEKNDDVRIYAMFDKSKTKSSQPMYGIISDLLYQYVRYSNGNIRVEYIDPTKNPSIYSDIGISDKVSKDGSQPFIVVKSGKKVKILTADDMSVTDTTYDSQGQETDVDKLNAEPAITGAINNVIADFTPKVYWLTGHGEKTISDEYSQIATYLKANNFDFEQLNILNTGAIPKDAAIVACASPKNDITSDEKDLLYNYLTKGGALYLMMDAAVDNTPYTNLKKLTSEYNISFGTDKVVETDTDYALPNDPLSFLTSAVATNMNTSVSNYKVVVRKARSITVLNNEKENVNATPVLETTEKAYADKIGNNSYQKVYGTYDVAAAADRSVNGVTSRMVVVGDSDFMADDVLNKISSYAFNTTQTVAVYFNWLQNQNNNLIISPKTQTNSSLVVTQQQIIVSTVITAIVIPILIIAFGIFVWTKRRFK